MKVLVTGHNGFVGREVMNLLRSEGHEVEGLDKAENLGLWQENLKLAVNDSLDAVIHCGAISHNQTDNPDIYLWNSYATYLLAERLNMIGKRIYFVIFSTTLIEETLYYPGTRSPYTWSKVQAEHFASRLVEGLCILRPAVIWGNESGKETSSGSVPYLLASHTLKHLFRDWRRRYVHVRDVAKAVNQCLQYGHSGIYNIASPILHTNQQLAELIEWEGYEWVDDPATVGFRWPIMNHSYRLYSPRLPGWEMEITIEDMLPKLEKGLNQVKDWHGEKQGILYSDINKPEETKSYESW